MSESNSENNMDSEARELETREHHDDNDEEHGSGNLLGATDPDGQGAQPLPRGGRPCKLTGERQHIIMEALTQGEALSTAARQAGISARTIFRWKIRGSQERAGIYHDFTEAIQQAVGRRYMSRNAVTPRQADLIALLERAAAATPWIDRSDIERELIQILMQRRVIPSR